MNRVLIIGCSHSQGSFEGTENGTENWKPRHIEQKERIATHKVGWWSFVDLLQNCDVKVIAVPGAGFLAYYEILKKLDLKDKLIDFDTLIIQETDEPRISFFHGKFLDQRISEFNSNIAKATSNNDRIKIFPWGVTTKGCFTFFPFRHDLVNELKKFEPISNIVRNNLKLAYTSSLFNELPLIFANKIAEICKHNKINMFAWRWSNKMDKNILLKNNKDVKNLMTMDVWNLPNVRTKGLNGHTSIEGNKNLGTMINDAIIAYNNFSSKNKKLHNTDQTFIIHNFLEEKLFNNILEYYPLRDFFKKYGHGWGNSRYNLKLQHFEPPPYIDLILKHPGWKDFINKINSPDFKNLLFNVLHIDLSKYCILDLDKEPSDMFYFKIDLAIANNGYFLKDHTDSRDKIISGMIYLNDILCNGGNLFLYNMKIKPERNKAVFWVNHNKSYHNVDMIENIKEDRKFIYIALMYCNAKKNIWTN